MAEHVASNLHTNYAVKTGAKGVEGSVVQSHNGVAGWRWGWRGAGGGGGLWGPSPSPLCDMDSHLFFPPQSASSHRCLLGHGAGVSLPSPPPLVPSCYVELCGLHLFRASHAKMLPFRPGTEFGGIELVKILGHRVPPHDDIPIWAQNGAAPVSPPPLYDLASLPHIIYATDPHVATRFMTRRSRLHLAGSTHCPHLHMVPRATQGRGAGQGRDTKTMDHSQAQK